MFKSPLIHKIIVILNILMLKKLTAPEDSKLLSETEISKSRDVLKNINNIQIKQQK